MIAPEALALLMFLSTLGLLLLGFPVALTLAGSALLFASLGSWLEVFPLAILGAYPLRVFGTMINEPLVAVPLFIFMGVMLERSRVASQLLETMGQMFGRLRGGLGLSVIFVGTLLAASTGIVGATVVTMGLLSLPTMLRAGYDPKLSTGLICASGTLGQIIPPSIVLILLADILQGANEEAAQLRGDLAPDPVSGIDLFAGAFLPGLLLVALYSGWQILMAFIRPASCPAIGEVGEMLPLEEIRNGRGAAGCFDRFGLGIDSCRGGHAYRICRCRGDWRISSRLAKRCAIDRCHPPRRAFDNANHVDGVRYPDWRFDVFACISRLWWG